MQKQIRFSGNNIISEPSLAGNPGPRSDRARSASTRNPLLDRSTLLLTGEGFKSSSMLQSFPGTYDVLSPQVSRNAGYSTVWCNYVAESPCDSHVTVWARGPPQNDGYSRANLTREACQVRRICVSVRPRERDRTIASMVGMNASSAAVFVF